MKKITLLLITSGSILCNTTVPAQVQTKEEPGISGFQYLLQTADKAMEAGNWKLACNEWEKIITLNPSMGDFWYKQGQSYFYNGQPDKAIGSFQNCLRIGASSPFEPFDCAYFIARCYAKMSDRKKTLDWLQKAFGLGYRNIRSVSDDSSFAPYFKDARFMELVGIPKKPFTTRNEGWRFDLRLMVREIKRRAPAPFRKINEKKFDSAVQTLHDKIPSLTAIQIITELMKIMALVSDGHTMIYGFFERPEFLQNLPFEIYKFEEGIFITDTDNRYKDLMGCQLIALDDKPIEEILHGLDPLVNRDNEQGPAVLGLMRMRNLPVLYGLGLIKSPDHVTITIKGEDEENLRKISVTADCPFSSRKLWDKLPGNWISYYEEKKIQPPVYFKNIYRHYWFDYFPADRTVYFQFNSIADDPGCPFNKFCDSLFDFIENNNTLNLVIDLRLNNGGNTMLTPYLLEKVIGCKKINQKGRLYGIIGRRTYSAAINLCGYLQRFTPITYIGEPTGSSPNFIGEDAPFELPYSKLMANVSDRYWQSSWPDNQSQWFAPLIYVSPRFRDFKAGKDPCLEHILGYREIDK